MSLTGVTPTGMLSIQALCLAAPVDTPEYRARSDILKTGFRIPCRCGKKKDIYWKTVCSIRFGVWNSGIQQRSGTVVLVCGKQA